MKMRSLILVLRPAVAVAVVLAALLPIWRVAAQTPTETKIRLLSEALGARDAGELERAREIAEQLQAMLPNDPNVRRLIAEIDTLIAAREEAARNPRPPAMQDVKIPEPTAPRPAPRADSAKQSAGRPPADVSIDLSSEAEAIAQAEARRIAGLLEDVPRQRQRARRLAATGHFDEALSLLESALAALPLNPLTKAAVEALEEDRRAIDARRSAERAKTSKTAPAASGNDDGNFTGESEIADLVARGRSQYVAGELDRALATFRTVETRDPDNVQAKEFLRRIADAREKTAAIDRETTRAQLLEDVTRSWQRPALLREGDRTGDASRPRKTLEQKLEDIVLPNVSFTRMEIEQVVAALSAISDDYDPGDTPSKGVNIVLIDPAHQRPTVTLALRNASLKRVLDFVTESIGYHYVVQADAVVLRPGDENASLRTAFFPVARATALRMTGAGLPVNVVATRGRSTSPVSGEGSAPIAAGEGPAMKSFLQQAGINFEAVPGATLAYDGSALIVTQTPRNLERIRNLLDRYSEVRQVEIEAKFIEVQEGALEELGVNWTIATKETQRNAGAQAQYQTSGRSLSGAFSNSNGMQQGRIVRPAAPTVYTDSDGSGAYDPGEPIIQSGQSGIDLPIINNAPRIPGAADLAAAANSLANITGIIGEFDVNAVVRALSQQQGTDLLSAPKVTVLSGNPATITVAQEMRYPQSFGQTQSQVGTGNASGGGSAGVAITAGTPQEFTQRNVGVELKVTPTVEEDDYSISLDLNPRVTEFDGFVEYGGPSIAISGSTTVTVPSGFYQPIFSVRDISTKVTIWDGATLVMGGLTREEVKKVNDKVPILGDLPLIGRAFRSKGESSQKRNLLIFVTANLVSPGGAPKKFAPLSAPVGSIYPYPAIVAPAGTEPRLGAVTR